MAIRKAQDSNEQTVILTDSQVGTKILRSTKPKTNKKMVYEIQDALMKNNKERAQKIYIQWIPAHKNLDGNENADKVAKQCTHLSDITFVHPIQQLYPRQ